MLKNIIIAITASAFISPAFATTQGEIILSGKVPEDCEIVVKENGKGRNIADLSIGATALAVGEVWEKCNDADGYRVTAQLTNGKNGNAISGLFVDSISRATVPFSFTYGGANATNSTVTNSNTPAIEFVKKEVAISYEANEALPTSILSTYSEQIKFTITAK